MMSLAVSLALATSAQAETYQTTAEVCSRTVPMTVHRPSAEPVSPDDVVIVPGERIGRADFDSFDPASLAVYGWVVEFTSPDGQRYVEMWSRELTMPPEEVYAHIGCHPDANLSFRLDGQQVTQAHISDGRFHLANGVRGGSPRGALTAAWPTASVTESDLYSLPLDCHEEPWTIQVDAVGSFTGVDCFDTGLMEISMYVPTTRGR